MATRSRPPRRTHATPSGYSSRRPLFDPEKMARVSAVEWRQRVQHFADGVGWLRRAMSEDDLELACFLGDALCFTSEEIRVLGVTLRELKKYLGDNHDAFRDLPDLNETTNALFKEWKQLSEALEEAADLIRPFR